MSHYGPPGGPHPDQPREPWQGRQPQDPYGPPDPYGQGGYDRGGYDEPSYDQGGYDPTGYGVVPGYPQPAGAPPEWGEPVPQPKKSRTGLIVTTAVVLALLVCGGALSGFYFLGRDKGVPEAQPTAAPSQPVGDGQSPQVEPSTDARFATKGQCLVNDGTDADPKMRIVKCGSGAYEVLARFDGTVDFKGKCSSVPGYRFHYYFDSELDTLDFVLCLRKR